MPPGDPSANHQGENRAGQDRGAQPAQVHQRLLGLQGPGPGHPARNRIRIRGRRCERGWFAGELQRGRSDGGR